MYGKKEQSNSLWKATAKSAEGEMARRVYKRIKEKGIEVVANLQDGDSSA